jgi:hypothetical protein
VRAAVAAFVALGLAAPVQAQTARLSRDVFDVIPPSERVSGEPGAMSIIQPGCRVGPTDWARRRIVDVAVQEWAFFGFQTVDARPVEAGRLPDGVVPDALNPRRPAPRQARHMLRFGDWEDRDRVTATVAGYWSATPDGAEVIGDQNREWRRTDRAIDWVQPWSAAFISWVMCEGGLGDMSQFARDISHRVYIDQAIRARDRQAPEAAFVAHDAGEAEIQPGDLLCNARGSSSYRTLADRRRESGEYAPLHCDIVVRVDAEAGLFHMIGGNVMNSVTLTILPGVRDGAHLRPLAEDDLDGARTMFAHLKLRAPTIEPNALDATPTIRAINAP